MQLPSAFHVGDRVCTVCNLGMIPRGSRGTIVRVFASGHCSDMLFDGFPWPHLVYHADLKPIAQPSASELI